MTQSSQELVRQLDRIVALGYPDVADMSDGAFRALAEPLVKVLERVELGRDILLVPTRELVPDTLLRGQHPAQGRLHNDAAA